MALNKTVDDEIKKLKHKLEDHPISDWIKNHSIDIKYDDPLHDAVKQTIFRILEQNASILHMNKMLIEYLSHPMGIISTDKSK